MSYTSRSAGTTFATLFKQHWQRGTFVLVRDIIRLWKTQRSAGGFAAVRNCMQTTPAGWCSDENGYTERWTEMQADGGGLETINLTLTADSLRNCIVAGRLGICVCVCVLCVLERDMWYNYV